MAPYDCDPWAAENPYEEAWQDQYCSTADTWGPYIWIAIGVLALVLLFLIYRTVKARAHPAPQKPMQRTVADRAATPAPPPYDPHAVMPGRTLVMVLIGFLGLVFLMVFVFLIVM